MIKIYDDPIELYSKIDLLCASMPESDKNIRARIISTITYLIRTSPASALNNLSLIDMSGEIWRDALGYEEYYMVSNFGRVKSLGCYKHEVAIKKQYKPRNTYPLIGAWVHNKERKVLVHRMVASSFIRNWDRTKIQVNHKFGCRVDNRASQLEWTTPSENSLHSFASLDRIPTVFTGASHAQSKPVIQYDINTGLMIAEYVSVTAAAAAMKVGVGTVSAACLGRLKTCAGFKWEHA